MPSTWKPPKQVAGQTILSPKQSKAWYGILENPNCHRILFDGGVRSTKTRLICAWLLKEISEKVADDGSGARVLIARLFREHARTTVFEQTLVPMVRDRADFEVHGDLTIHSKRTGGFIRVDGLDNAERVDKILGSEWLHIFINELPQVAYETMQVVSTRLSQPVGNSVHKLIGDANPKNQRHWVYQAAILGVDNAGKPLPDSARWTRQHWTPYDNPWLPKDTIEILEGLTGAQRRRMLDGEWCDMEGSVYDMFDEDAHVYDKIPGDVDTMEWVGGMDFGFVNPFCFLWAAIDHDGGIWIDDELYNDHVICSDNAATILAHKRTRQITHIEADHDAEDRATMEVCGLATVPASKSIIPGIEAVKLRFREKRLHINRRCVQTISELYDYSWGPSDKGKEYPLDSRNHAMDALRYIVYSIDKGTADGAGGVIVSPEDVFGNGVW